jgi:putative endonuclease
MNCAVYIMASQRNGTLYTGVTSDLAKRVWQHKNDTFEGFSKEYGTKMLVWYESGDSIEGAIMREKQIKKWNRIWKLRLIESMNPEWRDLSGDILG